MGYILAGRESYCVTAKEKNKCKQKREIEIESVPGPVVKSSEG